MEKEVISYQGRNFTRYPNSENRSDRCYYSGWVKIEQKWHKKRLHWFKYFTEKGEIPKGYDVHHIDGNTLNNEITNLQIIEIFKHRSEHQHNKTAEQKRLRDSILQNIARPKASEWHKSEDGKRWHRELAERNKETNRHKGKCVECGSEYESTFGGITKYCSDRCRKRVAARMFRNKKSL